jgi:DNA-binding NarL/FixJ family response regulator
MPVVLASRDPEVIERCRRAVSAEYQFEVFDTLLALSQATLLLRPSVVVIDACMLDRPFERQVASIASSLSKGCVVVMTPAFEEDVELALLKAGAKGCCRRGTDPESLRQVLGVAGGGGVWVTPGLIPRIVKELQHYAESQVVRAKPQKVRVDRLVDLTPREQEVVHLIVDGASNKEVAQALEIEERTVKGHVSNIFRKFGVSDRLKLVVHVKNAAGVMI